MNRNKKVCLCFISYFKMRNHEEHNILVEHFFRSEYGKMVSVVSKYLGFAHIEVAEDIVQETLLTAVNPPNFLVKFWVSNTIMLASNFLEFKD